MEYQAPVDDRPRYLDWETGTADGGQPVHVRWWLPTRGPYGGREDAELVIDSKGEMSIFHGNARAGVVAAPYAPSTPFTDEFWPLVESGETSGVDPARLSHILRDTGWLVAEVDDEYGLAQSERVGERQALLWRLAYAFTLAGFFPPLGVEFRGRRSEFQLGLSELGEQAARRVKRAMINRVKLERRQLAELSDAIEANWRA